MKSIIRIAFFAFALIASSTVFAQDAMAHKDAMMDKKETMKGDKMMKGDEVTIVELSQTPGEFNNKNLTLAPGNYIFKVTNTNVDHKVAFMLTPSDTPKDAIKEAGLPNLLKTGETAQSEVVTLTAGTYLYSCPLNPTPQYTLTVK